jgi:tryptophanyl-tRNA synthetase
VLQAADILLYKGDLVPVGEDQVPHVEIAREIARRFNNQYGPVFPEPEPKLTKFARLPGLDGADKKMSKSSGNTILLSDQPAEIERKMKTAVTDPQKVRRNDPGRPEICLVFTYHQKFNAPEALTIETDCRSGVLGCVDCKKRIAARVAETLTPFREKRAHFEGHLSEVKEILADGEDRGRTRARATMAQVHDVMKLG